LFGMLRSSEVSAQQQRERQRMVVVEAIVLG
jgi:hypothetical protein